MAAKKTAVSAARKATRSRLSCVARRADFGAGVDVSPIARLRISVDLDCALACAGATLMDEGQAATTADLRVEYFRPALAGRFEVRAEVRHRSRRLAFCQAVVSQDGQVVAEGRATIALVSI